MDSFCTKRLHASPPLLAAPTKCDVAHSFLRCSVAMLSAEEAVAKLADMPVEDLPGVGWTNRSKLNAAGIRHGRDVQRMKCAELQQMLGERFAGPHLATSVVSASPKRC